MEKKQKNLIIGVVVVLVVLLAGYGVLYSLSSPDSEGFLGFVRGGKFQKVKQQHVGWVVLPSKSDTEISWKKGFTLLEKSLPLTAENVDCDNEIDSCLVFLKDHAPILIEANTIDDVDNYFSIAKATLEQKVKDEGELGYVGGINNIEIVVPAELGLKTPASDTAVKGILYDLFSESLLMASASVSQNDILKMLLQSADGECQDVGAVHVCALHSGKNNEVTIYWPDGSETTIIKTPGNNNTNGGNANSNSGSSNSNSSSSNSNTNICPDCPHGGDIQDFINDYLNDIITFEEMMTEIQNNYDVNVYNQTEFGNFGNYLVQ